MDFNKLKDISIAYLQKGKEFAVDVAEKSKVEVLVLNNRSKLYRAQRQLGALVYSLAKGREENQPLVDKYIDAIAQIEQEIEDLKAGLTPEEKAEVEAVEAAAAESEAEEEIAAEVEEVAQEVAEEAAPEQAPEAALAEEEKPAEY